MRDVSPQLSVRRGREAVEFYRAAFGAEEIYRVAGTDEHPSVVSQLAVGDATFWVSDESPEHEHFSPETLGGTTTRLLLLADDPKGVVERAVALGGSEYVPVHEEHGWLLGRIEDPYGHHWEIGKPLGPWPPLISSRDLLKSAPMAEGAGVRLEPWGEGDLPLLRRILGDPAMTEHLGGPESEEKLVERQARYERVRDAGTGAMFKIVDEATGEAAGSVGYWEKEWRGVVYETGWSVLPEFQGRGIAVTATRLVIDAARAERKHRYLHAFPSVENAASNAICRKLGFELLEAHDFEYPAGSWMRCNDWRLDLFAG